MKRLSLLLLVATLQVATSFGSIKEIKNNKNDIVFNDLATLWDEGMPLGNAYIGALVWQKNENLRMAIDRIDLWDLRPTDSLSGNNFSYKWVEQQWRQGTYENVQKKMDVPYDNLAAPTKIPGAAIEFNIASLGKVVSNKIYINNGVMEVKWENGAKFQTFVHAEKSVGWFLFENVSKEMAPQLLSPRYQAETAAGAANPVAGQDLRKLEYAQGLISDKDGLIRYHQKGWGDDYYNVAISYEYKKGTLIGVWSISSSISEKTEGKTAENYVAESFNNGLTHDFDCHNRWWQAYWSRSSVSLPDPVIEKQYYNEIYKFGSLTRENSSIIPLQGVWTADNGMLPPWKGDLHHDLNTQLSYWPAYTGNMCDYGMGYLNTLWNQREENRRYTKQYFGVDGLNVPGVATLTGVPMGGWIQYSLAPTVAAWLQDHFYLHWKYTMDEKYLQDMGYPYVREVAEFLQNITFLNEKGERVLPISSSPEIFDNSPKAWFPTMTNYDLSLIYKTFENAAEMAMALNRVEESEHWAKLKEELPSFEFDKNKGLMFAKGKPYDESHRHFSNAMAVMPLSIFDVTKSEKDRQVVEGTIALLDQVGPDYWCGYSYSWLANMKARALDGEGTRDALKTFAECFVLRNGFHANGDQSKSGKSQFIYRPFTLEGNFAYASGVQEMLLQSHTGVLRIFPAIPADWKDVCFDHLRARGALLVSAKMSGGQIEKLTIDCERDGSFLIENPFKTSDMAVKGAQSVEKSGSNIYKITVRKNSRINLLEKN